jgi:hypothetical protein
MAQLGKRQECINDLIKTARSNKYSFLRKLASNEQGIANYLVYILLIEQLLQI